ncbi:MAG: GNAT family N-acetyltransferase [Fusobacteriaceae bacterium]|jgi:GNAT superfamily N-acetyltransferase|nr:GNAT family N-acetyltransferase [Fusobacteriaceae bacterium]
MEWKRTKADDPDFVGLVAELDSHLWGLYPEEQHEYAPKNIMDTSALILICLEEGKPVGCGCLRPYEGEIGRNDKVVEFKRMYVKKESRNKGTGRKILERLEAWAAEMGYPYGILETGPKNVEALSLYRSYGFQLIENYGFYKGRTNSICFGKGISNP